jgi:hypothetical protein
MNQAGRRRTGFTFAFLLPLFLIYSYLLPTRYDPHGEDFATYWQAGNMILAGQNVYDTSQWVTVRQREGTALHSEPTLQYPLPLAVLFSPLALLPLRSAYILWLFAMQLAVLASILILLQFYPARSGYLELLAILGIFLFRPMFSLLHSGQIPPLLLLFISLSIYLFTKNRWFAGGVALSILALKPSIGAPMLLLAGLWLLSRKGWRGIAGMITGGLALLFLGALVDPLWIVDYVSIGDSSLQKYFGMHPTLWGVMDQILRTDRLSMAAGLLGTAALFAAQAFLFWRKPSSRPDAFAAFATIVPAALLAAPYSWNYDQILLVVPIVFLLIWIAARYGTGKAALLMLGIVALAFAMLAVAYRMGHDVWSVLNTGVVWALAVVVTVRDREVASGKMDEKIGVTINPG